APRTGCVHDCIPRECLSPAGTERVADAGRARAIGAHCARIAVRAAAALLHPAACRLLPANQARNNIVPPLVPARLTEALTDQSFGGIVLPSRGIALLRRSPAAAAAR